MFPGKNAKDELQRIFKSLGTPTPDDYPGIVDLPEYNDHLPKFPRGSLKHLMPSLNEDGLDILKVFFVAQIR